MSSIRWDPLKDILNIQERMNRLLSDNFHHDDGKNGSWQPPVDIYETQTAVVITVELPGVPEDSIDVQVSDNKLTIKGEKPSPLDRNSDSYYRLERPYGKFSRSFVMPNFMDSSNVTANIKDGVLSLKIMKKQQSEPTMIKVVKG